MIKAAKGFIKCQIVRAENTTTANGIEYQVQMDPRIRVGEVLENNSDSEFVEGNRVYIPMGFGVEFNLREIEYVFVKPEAIVGYE